MDTSKIIIESPGMLTTVQDLGRFGYQQYGMPVSGAMDGYSFRLANLLVGNPVNAAGLELTLSGPELRFCGAGVIAVCGADMQPMINNSPIKPYRAIVVKDGDLLGFGQLLSGCRTYIAFAGGLNVAVMMASRSTCSRAGIGGFKGRVLKKGDEIPIGKIEGGVRLGIAHAQAIPDYQNPRPVRVIPGPEAGLLSAQGQRTLFKDLFEISHESDRMGYRLQGKDIELKDVSGDIISSGVMPGTIQLPGNGQPIILMADGQTSGGYARIAVVTSVDINRVAQLIPGESISFVVVGVEEAISLNRNMFKLLKSVGPLT